MLCAKVFAVLLLVASVPSSLTSRLGFQIHSELFNKEADVISEAEIFDIATPRPARQEDAGIIEYEEYEESPRMTSYVLEDGDGHMTVVEQQSHTIPGGHVFIQRSTSADGSVAVTTMSSHSSSSSSRQHMADVAAASAQLEGASGSTSLLQQLSQSLFAPRSIVMAPLNDLSNVFEAQQQRLSGLLMSRYIESATAAASQQLTQATAAVAAAATQDAASAGVTAGAGGSKAPCPHHQALMAELAEAAESAGYHDEAAWTTEQLAAAERLAAAQQEKISGFVQQLQHFEHQQPSLLALAAAASGLTVDQQLQDADNVPLQQLRDFGRDRAQPADAVSLSGVESDNLMYGEAMAKGPNDFADSSYTPEDQDEVNSRSIGGSSSSSSTYDDLELLGDDYLLVPLSFNSNDSLSSAWDAVADAAFNLYLFFWTYMQLMWLVLLVAGTAVLFVAFTRSLLQLRQAMAAAASAGVTSSRGCRMTPVTAAMPRPSSPHCQNAAGALGLQIAAEEVAGATPQPEVFHQGSFSARGSNNDLRTPLLLDAACEGLEAPLHQHGAATAAAAAALPAVQRFYNPLFYQRLPGQA